MRINGYRCDSCCKEHLLDPAFARSSMGEVIPTDWYFLSHGEQGYSKEPLMFCSVKCLWDWSEKQITGLREVKALPEENTRWKDW